LYIFVSTHTSPHQTESRLPHRLAALLVGVTFPLIWVGGLVTTYDAGMAVPDWPSTYGYNLFLYPWTTWLFGPWDLLIEHGHRLLGATAGIVATVLVPVLWRFERRTWVRWLGAAVWSAVVIQGILGGMRVRMDSRVLAQAHGTFGPAFFALATSLAVVTSRFWQCVADGSRESKPISGRRPQSAAGPVSATLALVLCYVQIALGAAVRHSPATAEASQFRGLVLAHIIVGILLVGQIMAACWTALFIGERMIARPALALAVLVIVQLGLGAATWVLNYGWPAGWNEHAWAVSFTVGAKGFSQSIVTTAHQANGSLLLAVGTVLTLRSWRIRGSGPRWNASGLCSHICGVPA
jgi:cytochrome c oxidase assembly protein subunit 15